MTHGETKNVATGVSSQFTISHRPLQFSNLPTSRRCRAAHSCHRRPRPDTGVALPHNDAVVTELTGGACHYPPGARTGL